MVIRMAAPGAPTKTGSIVSRYIARWMALLGPLVLVLFFGGMTLVMPFKSDNLELDRFLILAGLGAFLLVWSAVVWLWPTLQYRKLRQQGHVIEIRGRATKLFVTNFWRTVDNEATQYRAASGAALAIALQKISELDLATESGRQQYDTVVGEALRSVRSHLRNPQTLD